MKNLFIRITATMLCLCMVFSFGGALAEGELAGAYESARALLLYTENVTMEATASFSFDGVPFKDVEVCFIQAGSDFYRKIRLTSPKADGTNLLSGYTLTGRDYDLYVTEVLSPGREFHYYISPKTSILRGSVQLAQLAETGYVAATLLDAIPGIAAREESGALHITLKESTLPPLFESCLNLLAQYGLHRWFGYDFSFLATEGWSDPSYYGTVAEGICCSMRCVHLKEADLVIRMDDLQRLTEMSGKVELELETISSEFYPLTCTFSLNAGNYGTSTVEELLPAESVEGLG